MVSVLPTGALTYEGEELAGKAKVTMEEARSIALKAHPGEITSEELESEEGGSGLRYSFVVKTGTELYEVGVDAQTANVLEDAKEPVTPDAAEPDKSAQAGAAKVQDEDAEEDEDEGGDADLKDNPEGSAEDDDDTGENEKTDN
jgi:hypothetical protein